ncbi:MAG TPA: carboxypeptidase-like regulatory domain-containing protein [Candidatus Acidoferrum sp.]|nr:carboxypeptidase-like regulatory domain-containing protein [Candidatus Acidoferrum sp.]
MKLFECEKITICLAALILLAAFAGFADVGGKITGVVTDQSGGGIPGATVVVVNTATGQKQTATTDEHGLYSFPVLAVGQYDIEISCTGFQPFRRTGLTINVNSALQEDVTLRLQEHSESVVVEEAADQVHVETADTQMGQTLESQRIAEAPLNGRSFTNLLAVQTGVTPVSTGATSSTSSGGGFGAIAPSGGLDPGLFSVNGQRESANGFMVNGANSIDGNINDSTFGQVLSAMPPRLMQLALKFQF